MGILRADRVSGLGGANAINGSVFFGGDQHLKVAPNSDFNLADNDFTLECWINFSGFDGTGFDTITWSGFDGTAASRSFQWDYKNSADELRLVISVSDSGTTYASSWAASKDTWYHIAACRSGADLKLFVDGTQIGSTHNIGSNVIDYDDVPYGIGQRRGNLDRGVIGYISNYRLINGTALYTANFTAPTERLTNIDNTVLLCCQSPGNVLKEETGKTIVSVLDNLNNAPPRATHIAPDLGEDYGTTFTDNTKFDTLSYLVPPGGTTAQSNRGRGLFGGGYNATAVSPSITYVEMQSLGNSVDFGDLSSTYLSRGTASCSSSTRGLFGGGYGASPLSTGDQNTIEYVTIATTSNSTNFGDMTIEKGRLAALSNNTRGLFGGGSTDPTSPSNTVNTIGYVTIATTGNAADFGDLTEQRGRLGATANTTRGLFFQGNKVPSGTSNVIDYVTIASAGNATDFGDALAEDDWVSALASPTRAIYCGGNINQIGYVTIATTGNAVDFGDLIGNSLAPGCTSNGTRGVINISYRGANVNNIEYITIASTGNAKDFGDVVIISTTGAACSDSHGGIS